MDTTIKLDQILKLNKPAAKFLCPASANIFGIQFGRFKIRNMANNSNIVDVGPDEGTFIPVIKDDSERFIRYELPKDFLKLKMIGTTLQFKVGPKELKKFRMIERHYFGEKLLKSYDFTFGFCIPNSVNTWEAQYTVPPLTESEIQEIVKSPLKTKSDSYYLNEDKLIMHHRSEYMYYEGKAPPINA